MHRVSAALPDTGAVLDRLGAIDAVGAGAAAASAREPVGGAIGEFMGGYMGDPGKVGDTSQMMYNGLTVVSDIKGALEAVGAYKNTVVDGVKKAANAIEKGLTGARPVKWKTRAITSQNHQK